MQICHSLQEDLNHLWNVDGTVPQEPLTLVAAVIKVHFRVSRFKAQTKTYLIFWALRVYFRRTHPPSNFDTNTNTNTNTNTRGEIHPGLKCKDRSLICKQSGTSWPRTLTLLVLLMSLSVVWLACDLTQYIRYERLANDVNPQNLSEKPGGPIDPGHWPSFSFLLHTPLLAIFIPWNIHSYTFTDHHFKHFEIERGALLGCHFYHYKITKGSIQQPLCM